MWWPWPSSFRGQVVATVLLGAVAVVLLVAFLLWIGPYAASCWNVSDSRERDGVLLVLLVFLLMNQRRCKCTGKCGK